MLGKARNLRRISMKRPLIATAVAAFLFLGVSVEAQTGSPASALVEAKVNLEGSLEARLQSVLRKILGTPDVLVVVQTDISVDNSGKVEEILPGVPLKETPGLEINTKGSQVVSGIRATVYLDDSVSDAQVALAEKTAKEVLDLRFGRGDTVSIEKLALTEQIQASANAGFAERLMSPASLFSLAWLILAIMALGVLLAKFFTPLLSVLRTMAMASQQAPVAAPAAQATQQAAPLDTPDIPKRLARETHESDDEVEEELPFSFVRDRHLPMLKYLLQRAQPKTVAVVVHYLPAAIAGEILTTLDASVRSEIVQSMSSVVQLDPENVDSIEDSLRDRLDYLMGGEDKLAELLDEVPVQLQQEMLDAVRSKDATLGKRLGKRIVTLDDIAFLDATGLKTLSRRIPIKSLAAVLRSSDEIREKILPKLTSGLGAWLTQEIELSSDLTGDRLAEEQKKVLAALSTLIREGEVEIKKGDDEEDEAPAPALPVSETASLPEPVAAPAAVEEMAGTPTAGVEETPVSPPAAFEEEGTQPKIGAPGVSDEPIPAPPTPGEEKE